MVDRILGEYYEVQQQLGKQPGRQTLLARDLRTQELVVIKLLSLGNDFEWQHLKLFEREAETLKTLSHPAIPCYLDYIELDSPNNKGFALVQSYVAGKTLEQHLKAGRTFSEAEVKELAKSLLEILTYLHGHQPPVIHRDIKPSNILLTNRSGNSVGQVYLVDFGSVQTLAAKEGGTITVVGTYGYMPPEQFGGRTVPASDLYALGATLIHLLTGISPAELPQHQMRIQFREFVNINPEFANWIEQLIQPAPERRFSTARQTLFALQATQSPSLKNESVSKENAANYGAALFFTVLSGSVLIFSLYLIPSLMFGSGERPIQSEAKNNIGALNRAQQAYYLEYQEFTTDLAQLGVGLKTETVNYRYSIGGTKQAVFNYGVSRKKTLKSYVGGVFVVPATTLNPNADHKEMLTVAIICEALHPGTTQPAAPTLEKGKVTCGEGTRDLSIPKH